MPDDIKILTRGRWPSILQQLGLDRSYLSGNNGPCPMCQGKDRFRFTDMDGNGTYYCSHCGGRDGRGGGDWGVPFVMSWKHVNWRGACELVEGVLGKAALVREKAPRVGEDQARAAMKWQWQNALPLNGSDPASLYLSRRAITIAPASNVVRYAASMPDYDPKTKAKVYRPAMLSRFTSDDRGIIHVTFLTPDGQKADTPIVKRFFAGAKVPQGGSVRLGPPSKVMGVSTGMETSLSAMQRAGMPVWAVLNDVALLKFNPPGICEELTIFGDADDVTYSGYAASYNLAFVLARQPRLRVRVQMPPSGFNDWNDVLVAEAKQAKQGGDERGQDGAGAGDRETPDRGETESAQAR